jgi:hypothetical protein
MFFFGLSYVASSPVIRSITTNFLLQTVEASQCGCSRHTEQEVRCRYLEKTSVQAAVLTSSIYWKLAGREILLSIFFKHKIP